MSKGDQSGSLKIIQTVEINDKRRMIVAKDKYKGKMYLVLREQYKKDEDDEDWLFGKGVNLHLKTIGTKGLKKIIKGLKEILEKMEEKE